MVAPIVATPYYIINNYKYHYETHLDYIVPAGLFQFQLIDTMRI